MKQCGKCSFFLSLDSFVTDNRRKDKLYPYCKECSKAYYEANRSRLLEQKKEYSQREEVKVARRTYESIRYRENTEYYLQARADLYSTIENRAKLLLWKSRGRALADGIEHTISLEDIVIPETCPLLNIPLTHSLRKGQLNTNSSLDRIDNTKGYIPGNVQVISRLANTMKNSASPEQLLTFAQNIIKLYGIQGSNVAKYIETITA